MCYIFFKGSTSSLHRVAMLELAIEQKTGYSIELLEVEKGGISHVT